MGEEAELNEFCETSSWETNSALEEEEFALNTNGQSSSAYPQSRRNPSESAANQAAEDSDSDESLKSDQMTQERWEDMECDKFHKLYYTLDREIKQLEEIAFDPTVKPELKA